jgi:mono/diheme cytochrome c family protein
MIVRKPRCENAWEIVVLRKRESNLTRELKETSMKVKITPVIGLVIIGILTLVMAVLVFAAKENPVQRQSAGQPGVSSNQQNSEPAYEVTPVVGPSWLKLIGIFDIRFTAMGHMGGDGPPPPSPRVEPDFPVEQTPSGGRMGMGMGGMMGRSYSNQRFGPYELERMMNEKFLLAGADLYRLNCRACHGPNGDGSPPEISSLIGPVQGTSASLVEERMKKMGRPIGVELAKELAAQAEESIRQRFQNGGKKMPPFRHIDKEEANALLQYLRQHVGAPESEGKEILVTQSVARVGEHLVKGTCQICHDATGPGRGPMMGMMRGIIPSLASFPYEQSMQSIVWQVAQGSRPMMMGGQWMPAYPHITKDEAAASYLYLIWYPPY